MVARAFLLWFVVRGNAGKTKLLDKIRQTDVQGSEAGGITQQIGATFFPMSEIKKKTERLMTNMGKTLDSKLPGLLIIDTPGHESFQNLRQRGSSLCDIAILVVDIMHGLEPQTIESLNMLRKRKSPFIVALNKVDRLYDWKVHPDYPIQETLKMQSEGTLQEYETRLASAILALTEQGLNCEVYYKQKDFRKTVAVVPTSAVTGKAYFVIGHLSPCISSDIPDCWLQPHLQARACATCSC
jgi:translation initiation factor 5B